MRAASAWVAVKGDPAVPDRVGDDATGVVEGAADDNHAERDGEGWDVIWFVDEGLSAKSMDCPQLQAALARLHVIPKRRDVDGIVVAKLDRLSRSVHDFSGILKLAAGR